jgi:Cys-tRNA(Pro) deacylase
MSQTEHASVVKCREEFTHLGVLGEIIKTNESARTAQEAADALGVSVGQIVKSLVFKANETAVMVIASGSNRIDTKKVAKALNLEKVDKADADLVRAATGYAIGGVPPFGLASQMKVLIDPDLAQYEVVWAAAGHPYYVFPTNYQELIELSKGLTIDIKLD